MHNNKRLIPLPKDFAFDIFQTAGESQNNAVLGFHDCLEIDFVEAGGGFTVIEGKEFILKPGEFYIINNLERHVTVGDGSLKMLVILFDPVFIWQGNTFDYEYLRPFFDRNILFSNCVGSEDPLAPNLFEIIREIKQEWDGRQEGFRLVVKALLMKLLALLYRHFKLGGEISDDVKSFRKSYNRIRDVIYYINQNFNRDLTLDELAKVALMNKTYFSEFFKSVVQMNVSDYILNCRISSACSLLKTTDRDIIDISSDCGFKSISSFYKSFKKLSGVSPNQYRYSKRRM